MYKIYFPMEVYNKYKDKRNRKSSQNKYILMKHVRIIFFTNN